MMRCEGRKARKRPIGEEGKKERGKRRGGKSAGR